MITINTINNSWYFIKETVIKPNASLTYDETLLNKSETKDLLESVSSKRVSLSSEDLIKVQNRYNSFNSGGNVDLSGVISKIENIYKDDGGGVRSGVLVDEIDERIAADLDITEALSHKASLGVDGKITEDQIPEMVKDILIYPTYLDFPTVNQPLEKILIDSSLNKMYYWNGTAYVPLPASSDSVSEGVSNLYFTSARAQAAVINIQGNSATSSKLQTPRNIEISGDATSSPAPFDGSANISLSVTLENTGVSSGTYNNSPTAITPLTIDSKGRITGTGSAVTITPAWSSISSKPTTLSGYGITDAYTKTQVDSLIPAGGSGGYSGYGMTRPKFINGSSYYLTNVWHDYTFGWVPSCTYSSITFGNDAYMVPFIPLQNCTISAIGITTSSAFAGTIKFGFYSSGSDLKPNTRLFASSDFSTAIANTLLSASTGGISVTAGSIYWIALFVADTGNPSLTTITNNLFSIASSGYANTNSQVVAGYRFKEGGIGTVTDLPISGAGAGYYNTTIVPRLVFKIS